jgi:twinkle protein
LLRQPLVITEGEIDAISSMQSSFLRTISVPDGAPNLGVRTADDLKEGAKFSWIPELGPLLSRERCPEIIIASDGDENGAALLQDLSVLLGRFRCKFVTYPPSKTNRGRERCKDLNEVLMDYGEEGVRDVLTRAQWLRVDGVYRMNELPPLPPEKIYTPPDEAIADLFKARLGDLSVITGVPGLGKTTYANHLFCSIALAHDLTVAWASFEQEPQRDHKRNLRRWRGSAIDMEDVFAEYERIDRADVWINQRHVFIVPSEDEDASLEWLLDKMEVAVARFGASIIVIDPWNEIEHCRRPGESETEYIGRAIRMLKRFAKAFQVHICIIAHPTKSLKDSDGVYKPPTLYDISGSSNWYNKCDLGVVVHRPNPDDTVIKTQKSRYHDKIGRPGEIKAHFAKETNRFVVTERAA